MKQTSIFSSLGVASSVLLRSCASSPDFGDWLKEQGGEVSGIGEKWHKGEAMINKGNGLIKDGEDI